MSGAVDLEKSQLRPFLPASRHFDSFISDSPRSPSFQHTSGDALQDEFGYGPYPVCIIWYSILSISASNLVFQ